MAEVKVTKTDDEKLAARQKKWRDNHFDTKGVSDYTKTLQMYVNALMFFRKKLGTNAAMGIYHTKSDKIVGRRQIRATDLTAAQHSLIKEIQRIPVIFSNARKREPTKRMKVDDLTVQNIDEHVNILPTIAGPAFRGFLAEANFPQEVRRGAPNLFRGIGLNPAFLTILFAYTSFNQLNKNVPGAFKRDKDGKFVTDDKGNKVPDGKWYRIDSSIGKWFGDNAALYRKVPSDDGKTIKIATGVAVMQPTNQAPSTFDQLEHPVVGIKEKAKKKKSRTPTEPFNRQTGRFPNSAILQIKSYNTYTSSKNATAPVYSQTDTALWQEARNKGNLDTLIREYKFVHSLRKKK